MSMPLINFESSRKKEQQRQWEREARQAILEKAKNKYEAEQQQQEEARQRGEHSWMLPSVESRLQSTHTSKKKKKEKKKKKKKEKKTKKKKKSDSSSSSNETDDEGVWVEKSASSSTPGMAEGSPKPVRTPPIPTPSQPQDPHPTEKPVKRDEWMEMTSLFGTYSREQMREREGTSRKKQKEEEERRKIEAEKPGSHARELNPYFRDGGTGLPEERSCETVAGPGMNAEWLRRSMKRAQEQAQQEKRPLVEIAVERWGSLEKYNELLAQAEGQETKREESKQRKESARRRSRSRERQRSDERESKRGSEDYGRRGNEKQENDDERGSRRRSRGRDNESDSIHDKRRSGSRRRERRSRERRSRSKERRRHRRYSSSSRSSSSNSSYNSSSSSRSGSRRRSKDDQRRSFNSDRRPRVQGLLKPVDDFRSAPKQSSLATRFLKPGEAEMNRSFLNVTSRDSSKSGQGWKKQEFRDQPKQPDPQPSRRVPSSSSSATSCTSSESEDEAKKEDAVPRKSMHNTDKAGPSASSDGGGGDGSSCGTAPATQPLGPLLNDKEMNELAAKIMKAELIGNEAQANKLKAKMEAARAARANSSQSGNKTEEGEAGVTEQVVVLTRMNDKGICRPVMSAGGGEEWGGRRKKKRDTRTHGRDGQRARYFPDDDARDLKSMFEQEKGTTAEDQNSLFEDVVKGAGERLDEEYDLDDMFMSKIATKDTMAKQAERDRLKAIQEHKRSERSLESCRWCFDNKEMPKHLIVALGTKCYVCLPHHQSLTPGHCLIVPIHHVPCAVQADEDLWAEIQNFRKSLVKMFSSRDEDCVFFETVKRLRHFPHMAITCVPLPKEVGEMAPMYFKKAILECEQEWAQNKKLVDLKNRDVRSSVPRGLPYFFVDFGMESGFAHVIEDEQDFPNNFAQEIVGGMLDLDKNLWRKPHKENFDYQRRKVMEFSKWYKEFDPTQEDKE